MITGESRASEEAIGRRGDRRHGERRWLAACRGYGHGEKTALAGIMRLVERGAELALARAGAGRSRRVHADDRRARRRRLTRSAGLSAGATRSSRRTHGHRARDRVPARARTGDATGCRHLDHAWRASGLLVRDRRGLEEARNLDAVVFDKTGTLTRASSGSSRSAKRTASTADDALAHRRRRRARLGAPRSRRAVVSTAEERGSALTAGATFRGHRRAWACEADVDGRAASSSAGRACFGNGAARSPELAALGARVSGRGQAAIASARGDGPRSRCSPSPTRFGRSRARRSKRLHAQGIEVIMMTGDAQAVADRGGGVTWGSTRYSPRCCRSRRPRRSRSSSAREASGDGWRRRQRCAGALTADVGIAIGAGTDVAVEAGDIVLVRSDPRDIPDLTLSQATYRKMMQNLWWAAGYNIVAIPLAAGVLARGASCSRRPWELSCRRAPSSSRSMPRCSAERNSKPKFCQRGVQLMTTSEETADLNHTAIREMVERANSLTLQDRLALLKGLMPGVAREVTPREFEAIVGELRLKGERFYDAVNHPGEGRASRHVMGERDFEER